MCPIDLITDFPSEQSNLISHGYMIKLTLKGALYQNVRNCVA